MNFVIMVSLCFVCGCCDTLHCTFSLRPFGCVWFMTVLLLKFNRGIFGFLGRFGVYKQLCAITLVLVLCGVKIFGLAV